MLNPNTRANTMISQSFIASQFQTYNDPFTKAEPTSSLNQFVRSKQTSDSGFIQDGENQSFGFGNITANYQPKQLQSFSRKANQSTQPNTQNNRARFQSFEDDSTTNQPQKPIQKLDVPQQLNQRYISPNVVKTDSPTKINQFNQPQQNQRPPQQFMNMQPSFNQQQQFNENSFKVNQQQSQGFSNQQTQGFNNQQSRTQTFTNQQQSRPQSFSTQNQYSQQQLGNSQLGGSQLGSSQLSGSRPSLQQNGEGSSVGKRLKLNVSQQFSNSLVLKCVNEPQKTSILSMKQRQRQFRKSIQNFFV